MNVDKCNEGADMEILEKEFLTANDNNRNSCKKAYGVGLDLESRIEKTIGKNGEEFFRKSLKVEVRVAKVDNRSQQSELRRMGMVIFRIQWKRVCVWRYQRPFKGIDQIWMASKGRTVQNQKP
ncbi:hypothetical protein Q3G72_028376 [Acer saccharum]|nr:hypothetical protein Q3G72_028376 [Acer saccharum]